MGKKLEGRVAVITGAGRGQGRAHSERLAAEGADIIAIDICADIDTVPYSLSNEADLAETARLVEKQGRRVTTKVADVRDRIALQQAITEGVAELGRLDIVVANAGVCSLDGAAPVQAYFDSLGTDYFGVVHTVEAALPHLPDGASIICTGSTGALMAHGTANPAFGPGGAAYTTGKRHVGRFVHEIAAQLAPRRIRVNAIHPYNVNTALLHNPEMYRVFRPDLEHPTREDAEQSFPHGSPMGLSYLEPSDVAGAVAFLASDDARYITGVQLKIDGGQMLPLTSSGMPD